MKLQLVFSNQLWNKSTKNLIKNYEDRNNKIIKNNKNVNCGESLQKILFTKPSFFILSVPKKRYCVNLQF